MGTAASFAVVVIAVGGEDFLGQAVVRAKGELLLLLLLSLSLLLLVRDEEEDKSATCWRSMFVDVFKSGVT